MSEKTNLDVHAGTGYTIPDQSASLHNSFACRCGSAAKAVVPASLKRWIRKQQHRYSMRPPLGWVRFGALHRLTPISSIFGLERGQSVDHYYVHIFLQKHTGNIRECVLEMADPWYTRQFGGNRMTHSEVLHAVPGNPLATLIGDLVLGQGITREACDCIILTQNFPFIYNVRAAIATV